MLKSLFSYKSSENIGGLTFILNNVKVLNNFGLLLKGEEYSTIEIDFEFGTLRAYKLGELVQEFNIHLTASKIEDVRKRFRAEVYKSNSPNKLKF